MDKLARIIISIILIVIIIIKKVFIGFFSFFFRVGEQVAVKIITFIIILFVLFLLRGPILSFMSALLPM